MAYEEIIEALYVAGETAMTDYSTQRKNARGFKKPNNAVWDRISILEGESFNQAICGSKMRKRNPGLLVIQIFAPLGSLEAELNVAARKAQKYFDALKVLSVGDAEGTVIHFRGSYPVDIDREGGEFQKNVNVNYYFDTIDEE